MSFIRTYLLVGEIESMKKPFDQTPFTANKVAMLVEYAGQHYHGWQRQEKPFVPTVQHVLEQALSKVANHEVSVFCSGRTDAGVHGTSQLVHFETQAVRSQKAWVCGVNANLPDDVVIRWAGKVDDDFHARFSATARTYRYLIANTPVRPANMAKQLTWHEYYLDAEKMHEAAQALIGEHDFSAYRGAACQSHSANRFVEYIQVKRLSDYVLIEIKANAFLLHMVRNIVGVLLEVGEYRQAIDWPAQVLASKDRQQAGVTAKPHGLYFVRAHYDAKWQIPELAMGPVFLSHLLD